MQENMFLKVDQVAEILQVSPRQVLNMCKDEENKIPHIRINGRSLRFRKSDLDRWFDKHIAAAV
jgi:excisionase family DNA binding protein